MQLSYKCQLYLTRIYSKIFFLLVLVLRPFQDFFTYFELIVNQKWTKNTLQGFDSKISFLSVLVLRPFQDYFTYFQPIIIQRLAKTGISEENHWIKKKKKNMKNFLTYFAVLQMHFSMQGLPNFMLYISIASVLKI